MNPGDKGMSDNLNKAVEEILAWGRATAPDGTEMVMLNDKLETMIPLAQALTTLINNEKIAELEKLRKSFRGEDPDQYRPKDLISMHLVEEILDAHLATLKKGEK